MVPVASIVLIWQVIFHYNGALNAILGLLDPDKLQAIFGVSKIDWLKSDYAQFAVVTLLLWKNLGYNMILFMASLANIPRELLEVAEVEGASRAYSSLPSSCATCLPPSSL
jgi:multiple sugar transport system permease protein